MGIANNTLLRDGGSDATLCLVGRELCLFTTLDASKTPARQRKQSAALAARRAAPFADPDFDVAWSADGAAAIWYWSRARATALAAGEPGKRKRFVAEALYLGQPVERGTQLLQLAEGVEARAWRDGRLQASRWWPQAPTPAQWGDFLRGCGQPVIAAPPVPEATALSASPWSRQSPGGEKLQLSGFEQYLPKAAFALGALLLLLFGAQLGGIARAQADIWRARSAATRLDAPIKRILDAREATDKASAEIAGLLSLRGPRPTISLMAELTRVLPKGGWQVAKWSQPTPDTLEIGLLAPNGNPEALVSALEDSPMFQGVTTELGQNNLLTLKATVSPPPALGGDAEQSSPAQPAAGSPAPAKPGSAAR